MTAPFPRTCLTDPPGVDRARRSARGFSLVEVLLAVFILGIGIIAISALFPAGIAQQQQSVDDIIGPLVANNALAVLRSKLSPEDFGAFESDFGAPQPAPANGVQGDWPWLRPAYYEGRNAIDIFNGSNSPINESAASRSSIASGLPYNTRKYPAAFAPTILFYQHERYYPMGAAGVPAAGPPQYVWDCMFRRFQGRILVAIFVYRAMTPGGGESFYQLQPSGNTPPLPHRLSLPGGQAWDANQVFAMTDPGDPFDPFDLNQAWQAPRQWILDQNNNIHRVLSGRRDVTQGPVEFTRPVPEVPPFAVYQTGATDGPDANVLFDIDVVTDIWYIPDEVPYSGGTFGGPAQTLSLTPVYVTVRGL